MFKSRVCVLSNTGDHGSKVWALQGTGRCNVSPSSVNVTSTLVSDTDAAGGVVDAQGTDANGTFALDVSGTTVRFRVTPASSNNMTWWAEHDATLFIP
jgi:hypothetical protein